MPQPHQPIPVVAPTYVTPITCPNCGANAHLMRRTPHPEFAGELRTFECKHCGRTLQLTVKD